MKNKITMMMVCLIPALITVAGVAKAAPAGPQWVYDSALNTEESKEWGQQILDMGKELTNMDNQYKELKYQATDLDSEIKQLTNFQNYDVQDEIDDLNKIFKNSSSLGKSFNTYHPGYVATNSDADNSVLVNNTMNALQSSVTSLSTNASDSENDTKTIDSMEADAKNAIGTTSAVQAEAELTSAEIAQIQLLRQAVLAEASAQVAAESYQVQKDASAAATQDKIIQAGDSDVTGDFSGNSLMKPVFH